MILRNFFRHLYSIVNLSSIKLMHFRDFHFSTSTIVDSRVKIGVLNHGKIKIGKSAVISRNSELSSIGGQLSIGKNVFFNSNCSIVSRGKISIGDYCSFGPNVAIFDHDHDFRNGKKGDFLSKPIIIGNNVWIGAGCILLRGTEIGDNCVIGAGTLLKTHIPQNSIVTQERTLTIKNIVKPQL